MFNEYCYLIINAIHLKIVSRFVIYAYKNRNLCVLMMKFFSERATCNRAPKTAIITRPICPICVRYAKYARYAFNTSDTRVSRITNFATNYCPRYVTTTIRHSLKKGSHHLSCYITSNYKSIIINA